MTFKIFGLGKLEELACRQFVLELRKVKRLVPHLYSGYEWAGRSICLSEFKFCIFIPYSYNNYSSSIAEALIFTMKLFHYNYSPNLSKIKKKEECL